jgi:hypothetical protein
MENPEEVFEEWWEKESVPAADFHANRDVIGRCEATELFTLALTILPWKKYPEEKPKDGWVLIECENVDGLIWYSLQEGNVSERKFTYAKRFIQLTEGR